MSEDFRNKIVANSRIVNYMINELGYFDFNEIEPMPDLSRDTISQEEAAMYKWMLVNWGCMSNAENVTFLGDDTVAFSTVGGRPLNVFRKICKLFSNSYITFECIGHNNMRTTYNNMGGELIEMGTDYVGK